MDIDPRSPNGITASTTLGELASWVDPAPVRPRSEELAVETDAYFGTDSTASDTHVGTAGDEWALNDPGEVAAAARARQAPYVALGTTAAVGYGLYGVAELAALAGPDARSVTVTGTVVATALAVPLLWAWLRARIADGWQRRWWLATSAAAAWVDLTVADGPSWIMLAVLVVATAALSARWAAENELPNPSDIPEPEPAPAPPVPAPPPRPPIDRSRGAQIEKAWKTRVAAGANPAAAGSRLVDRKRLPNGDRWIVQLDPEGSVGCTDLIVAPVRLARPLQVNPAHVILERLEAADDREDLAVLTVVTKDLLAAGVPYTGPRYHDGRIPYGLYADGTGEAQWITYDGTGVRGGLVAGGQGSGKSALMAALGMAYRASGEWRVLFGDGDETGNSSHLLKRVAHDFAAGPEEVLQQLEALEVWYRYRGTLLPDLTPGRDGAPVRMTDPQTQESVDWIRPCPAFPGYAWFLDELHRLAADPYLQAVGFIPRAAMLQRIMRKVGGTIIAGTQSLLAEDFAGDSAFRGMLAQGNLIALRTENKSEQNVVGDFGISPSSLPKGGGYAFANDGVRQAMVRVAWSDDMHRWTAGLPELPDTDPSAQVYARFRATKTIDPVADAEHRARELARWDAALATGAPLPGAEPAAAAPAGQRTTVGGVGVPQPPARKLAVVPDPAVPDTADKSQPGESQLGATAETRPAAAAPAAAMGPLPVKAATVLAALQSRPGPWRSRDLVKHTNLSGPDVSKALGMLVARGFAHRPEDVQGVYAAGRGRAGAAETTG